MTPLFAQTLDLSSRRYAIGLSGGADSVYLAMMASRQLPRDDLVLVHVNHHLRGPESDADEAFCVSLAHQLDRPIVVRRRSEIEPILSHSPANPSARYRAVRLQAFRQTIETHHLDAVLLAHHADDQAQTVLMRLARGGSIYSLCGMKPRTRISDVNIERPILDLRAAGIRASLQSIGQAWREDSSNASSSYRRNIARHVLTTDPTLTQRLCDLANASQRAIETLDQISPVLPQRFACQILASLPHPVASHAARRWLIEQGCDADDVSQSVCERLIAQAADPTTPLRQHYPGQILVKRKQSHLEVLTRPASAT
jgi:tRNA(Ile)-lysidine synthase